MARTRLIHPEYFRHEGLAELPLGARVLFPGLWTLADREGRLEDRPRRIKADLFPYEDVDIDPWLWALTVPGFIVRYESGGRWYISIPSFTRWQNPHLKEKASEIPGPDTGTVRAPYEHQAIRAVSNTVSDLDTVSKQAELQTAAQLAPGGRQSAPWVPTQDEMLSVWDEPEEGPQPAPAKKSKPRKAGDPRHTPVRLMLEAVFFEIRGSKYPFEARDGKAVTRLLGFGTDAEIERVWRKALALKPYPGCSRLWLLADRWPDLVGTGPVDPKRHKPTEAPGTPAEFLERAPF